MKKELRNLPEVNNLSGSYHSIGTADHQWGIMVKNEETNEFDNYPMTVNPVDYNFFDFYSIEFVKGGPPTLEGQATRKEFVVNESFVKRVGWKENPIGKEIGKMEGDNQLVGRVVGVIKDIHHNTLHNPITSICFHSTLEGRYLSLKINQQDVEKALPKIELIWSKYLKDRPFDYRFMDTHIASLYETETRLGKLLLYNTLLSILIACLGLLALSAIIIQQRMKEVGIRKVLGASILGIVGLLSKDFLKLVIIALIIASPFAWYLMNYWLQNFAYHVDIHWSIFLVAGLVALSIAFLTVGLQSLKAAMSNPVDSIKTE